MYLYVSNVARNLKRKRRNRCIIFMVRMRWIGNFKLPLLHVSFTRPYHCSPPCRSLFYSCVVSNSVALCERRQAHDDTFSCVSFHGKSTTTTTRISEGCIHQESTKLPKSRNGKRRIEKKEEEKRVCGRSLKIFGVSE